MKEIQAALNAAPNNSMLVASDGIAVIHKFGGHWFVIDEDGDRLQLAIETLALIVHTVNPKWWYIL